MSVKGLASLYAAGKLRGDRDSYADPCVSNGALHVGHRGAYLRMHSAVPPPVEEYEAWLCEYRANADRRSRTAVSGQKLRRMVVMRRGGSTLAECARAVGLQAPTAKRWFEALPPELTA